MAKPTHQDTQTLLRVMEVYLSEPLREARRFWRTIPDGLSLEEFSSKYPRESGEFEHIDTIMIFWETVGSLLKRGIINPELAFDTFLDAPPWKKVERVFKEIREKMNDPLEGENLELAYKLSQEWKKKNFKSRQTR